MKKTILALTVTMLCGLVAHAGAPGIIIVKGSVNRQSNPQGRCGASTYGYVVYGTYTDSNGEEQQANSCLDGLAVPLAGTMDAGTSNNLFRDATNTLKLASGVESTLVFAADDLDNGIDGATLLSITAIPETPAPAAPPAMIKPLPSFPGGPHIIIEVPK